jgi:hypothetical protein
MKMHGKFVALTLFGGMLLGFVTGLITVLPVLDDSTQQIATTRELIDDKYAWYRVAFYASGLALILATASEKSQATIRLAFSGDIRNILVARIIVATTYALVGTCFFSCGGLVAMAIIKLTLVS